MSDDQWATFREHADLDKRFTALDAAVTSQLSRISSDLTEIKMLAMRPPAQPQETAAALALHNAADALRTAMSQKGSGTHPVLLFLSGLGLLAIGGGIAWVVLH